MKLYKVMGNLWELTPYQSIYSDVKSAVEKHGYDLVASDLIVWKDFSRSGLRLYKDKTIRSKGRVIIQFTETEFRDYDVYFDRKGFYSNVKGEKIYLADIMDEATKFEM